MVTDWFVMSTSTESSPYAEETAMMAESTSIASAP